MLDRIALTRGFMALCAALAVAIPMGTLAAPTERALYAFPGGSDGAYPAAGLITDSKGNLYGTTQGGGFQPADAGTVFELTPPATASGTWTETVLYAFMGGSDGAYPEAGLLADSKGNLYGTTQGGGTIQGSSFQCGTVFELMPPATAGGAWTEMVLHAFTCFSDGDQPIGGLIADNEGNLYGTTSAGGAAESGTVFKLTPPATAEGTWTETVLYAFTGGSDGASPIGTLLAGSNGNLYGTTFSGGYSDSPSCNFSGCGCGTVFELTPPATTGGAWTEKVLHAFRGCYGGGDGGYPLAGLIADSKGNLYGTSSGGFGSSNDGTVFELTPPLPRIHGWLYAVLHAFAGGSDGVYPEGGLIADSEGNLYGTTQGGGGSNDGTVFELTGTGSLPPPPPRICAPCRSPPICCACAGGIWTGKECL